MDKTQTQQGALKCVPLVGMFKGGIMKITWTLLLFISLFSCFFGYHEERGMPNLSVEKKDNTDKEEEKYSGPLFRDREDPPSREKYISCKNMGEAECDSRCEDICDEIFSKASHRQKCSSFPKELVEKFETLWDLLGDGDSLLSEIRPPILECFLGVSETPFVRKARHWKRENTEKFLDKIASDKNLAQSFRFSDSDGLVLTRLFKNLNYSEDRILRLAAPVTGRINFFEIALEENNEDAWQWIHKEVKRGCENSSDSCKYQKNEQDYFSEDAFYCRMLRGIGKGRLKSAVRSKLFADYFAKEMESLKVCGPADNESCDVRYIDHFESFCGSAYTSDTCLKNASDECL